MSQPLRYNIVFVLIDDGPPENWEKMGYLDSLPDGKWQKFTNVRFNNSLCGPSRVTMLTGRHSLNHGAKWHGNPNLTTISPAGDDMQSFDLKQPGNSFASWLQDAGYNTALFGKYLNFYPWQRGDKYKPPGWNKWFAMLDDKGLGGVHVNHRVKYLDTTAGYYFNNDCVVIGNSNPDTWTGLGTNTTERDGSTGYNTDFFSHKARAWIQNTAPQPFFCELSFIATHADTIISAPDTGRSIGGMSTPATRHKLINSSVFNNNISFTTPYHSPAFNEADISNKPAWFRNNPDVTPTQFSAGEISSIDDVQKTSWRCVQAVDEAIYDLVQTLTAANLIDTTVIVVTTDNGFMHGDHRLTSGKEVAYEPSQRTNMYIRWPTLTASSTDTTSFIGMEDLAPTFCDIAGARHTKSFDGMSLVPLMNGSWPSWPREQMLTEYMNNTQVDPEIPTFAAVTARINNVIYKYIESEPVTFDGTTYPAELELYDLNNDPYEMTNLTPDGVVPNQYAALVNDLKSRLVILQNG